MNSTINRGVVELSSGDEIEETPNSPERPAETAPRGIPANTPSKATAPEVQASSSRCREREPPQEMVELSVSNEELP